jgi:hypothetical protein
VKKKIPFDFILDYLHPLEIKIRPMFGCHALYEREKILLVLRKREDHPNANGVWVATGKEHHESLKKEFPSLESVHILSNGKVETNWQMIQEDADDFEESAIRLCEIILKGDERIGKVPKPKKSRLKKMTNK